VEREETHKTRLIALGTLRRGFSASPAVSATISVPRKEKAAWRKTMRGGEGKGQNGVEKRDEGGQHTGPEGEEASESAGDSIQLLKRLVMPEPEADWVLDRVGSGNASSGDDEGDDDEAENGDDL
jgi:hypothetical protein